jgi:sec-independent protein translocase protein TatA
MVGELGGRPEVHSEDRKEQSMFRQFGGGEILLILAVLVLLFGARKLPDLARSLGASAKEFRKGVEEGSEEEQPASEKSPTE